MTLPMLSAFGGASPDKPLAGTAQGSVAPAAKAGAAKGLAARPAALGLTRGTPGLAAAAPGLAAASGRAAASGLFGKPTAMRVARTMRGGKR